MKTYLFIAIIAGVLVSGCTRVEAPTENQESAPPQFFRATIIRDGSERQLYSTHIEYGYNWWISRWEITVDDSLRIRFGGSGSEPKPGSYTMTRCGYNSANNQCFHYQWFDVSDTLQNKESLVLTKATSKYLDGSFHQLTFGCNTSPWNEKLLIKDAIFIVHTTK